MAIVKSGPPHNISFFMPGTTTVHPAWIEWFNRIEEVTGGTGGLSDTATTPIADLPTSIGLGDLAYENLSDKAGLGVSATGDKFNLEVQELEVATPALGDFLPFTDTSNSDEMRRATIENMMLNSIGGILQVQTDQYTTSPSDITAVIPVDNTKPQLSEGTELMSIGITPKSADSTLLCFANVFGRNRASSATLALFNNSSNDAIAVCHNSSAVDTVVEHMTIFHSLSTPSTDALTFSVRIGININSFTVNSNVSGAAFAGGSAASTFWIVEYLPQQ